MSSSRVINARTVNLSNRYQEQIHLSGLIQSHGILFGLTEPQLEIVQVSNNVFNYLGLHPQELLRTKLEELFGSHQISLTKPSFLVSGKNINPIELTFNRQIKRQFSGFIHRSDGILVLELEPKTFKPETSFVDFYHLVKGAIAKIQNAASLQELYQLVVKEVRKLTGFDRVMLYRFDAEGTGTVTAEDKHENLSPYLNLHYPALDIPESARHLFALNSLRLIPNVNYQPVELIPYHNPLTNAPLDLSYSVLRSVSPCHIEYLNNMGVTASMSIPLTKNNNLWGLIACHHQSAKYLTYELRTACEFLGQVMSLELAAKEERESLDYKIKLKSIQSKFVESIPQEENFVNGLVKNKSNLLELVSAQGAAVCSDGHLTVIGNVPQTTEIQALIEWIEAKTCQDVFYTDSLPQLYPAAEKFKHVASGLLALSISKVPNNFIVWFRPEVIQTVNWGGDPYQLTEVEQNGSWQLSPRKSFELWQETVRLKSLPWQQCEIDSALELRGAIVGIVLRKASELAKINAELERSNSELDAFAYIASHDLKEPLRGIHNYSSFLIEDYGDILNEDGVSKLQTLMRLTQRMEDLIDSLLHFSRLGRVKLSMQNTNLNELVQSVIDILTISLKATDVEIRIPRLLPTIQCDRVQVSEVFSNLIGNAIKYNKNSNKWVEIGFLDAEQSLTPRQKTIGATSLNQPIVFYVKDNGIGIREKYLDAIFRIFKRLHGNNKYGGGTGAGLTITKKIVERHDGKIWVESVYGEGSTFYFTLSS